MVPCCVSQQCTALVPDFESCPWQLYTYAAAAAAAIAGYLTVQPAMHCPGIDAELDFYISAPGSHILAAVRAAAAAAAADAVVSGYLTVSASNALL
jgi:hypothetical protein